MAKVMLTVKLDREKASLAAARETLGLAERDIDRDFGVVEVDPDRGLYTVLVEEEAAANANPDTVEGRYSNPKIEPFGTPRR